MLDVLANNVDPDVMLHSATFYLGLHCLSPIKGLILEFCKVIMQCVNE